MNRSKLILVGGFLGAGKTSLLWKASQLLDQQGARVGMITNDQATNLVDTAFLQRGRGLVREVSGSCFCCNFNGFADAVSYIAEKNPGGVILAEPVGSCTDLSATLMQPLKDQYTDTVDLAPLTVLADPEPEKLLSTVQRAVGEALNGISFQQTECRCLTPGRPNPTYRYDRIIGGRQESI